jgi:hypothetical protein
VAIGCVAAAISLAACGGSSPANSIAATKTQPPAATSQETISASALESCLNSSGAGAHFIDAIGGANKTLAAGNPVLTGFSGVSPWGRKNLKAESAAGGAGLDVYVLASGKAAQAAKLILGNGTQATDNVAWRVAEGGGNGFTIPASVSGMVRTCLTAGATIDGDPPLAAASSTSVSGLEAVILRGAAGDLAMADSDAKLATNLGQKTSSLAASVEPVVKKYESAPSKALLRQIAALDPALVKYDQFGGPSSLDQSEVKLLETPSSSSSTNSDGKMATAAVSEILTYTKGQAETLTLPDQPGETLRQFFKETATIIQNSYAEEAALLDLVATRTNSPGVIASSVTTTPAAAATEPSATATAPSATTTTTSGVPVSSCGNFAGVAGGRSTPADNIKVTGASCTTAYALLEAASVSSGNKLVVGRGYACEATTLGGEPGVVCTNGTVNIAWQDGD